MLINFMNEISQYTRERHDDDGITRSGGRIIFLMTPGRRVWEWNADNDG